MIRFNKELKKMVRSKNKNFPRSLALGLQWVSVGYSSALYFAGKKIGKEIVSKEIRGRDIKSILKGTGTIFKNMGIGNLSVKSVGKKEAVLVLKNGATANGMARVGKRVCFFEAGLISGILEGKFKKNFNVSERKCGGLGNSEEEFVVKL